MKRRKCGLNSVSLHHPFKFVASIAAIGFHGGNRKANFIDFTVRKQRRVVRSAFGAELNGRVGSIESVLLRQCTLHQLYRGTAQSPQRMIDLLEGGLMYPPLHICADARAVCDATSATDVCEPAGWSLKLHLISVRDRTAYGPVRKLFWVDARDMLADGLNKGGIDRFLFRNASCDCKCQAIHAALVHAKHSTVGSATKGPPEEGQ